MTTHCSYSSLNLKEDRFFSRGCSEKDRNLDGVVTGQWTRWTLGAMQIATEMWIDDLREDTLTRDTAFYILQILKAAHCPKGTTLYYSAIEVG